WRSPVLPSARFQPPARQSPFPSLLLLIAPLFSFVLPYSASASCRYLWAYLPSFEISERLPLAVKLPTRVPLFAKPFCVFVGLGLCRQPSRCFQMHHRLCELPRLRAGCRQDVQVVRIYELALITSLGRPRDGFLSTPDTIFWRRGQQPGNFS